MQWLFTGSFVLLGLVILAACVAVWLRCLDLAQSANEDRKQVDRQLHAIRELTPRITAAEGTIESVRTQLRRLEGKFHAEKWLRESEPDEQLPDEPRRDDLPPVCENYQLAQIDGPRSKAAACECRYCLEMRHRRSLARGFLVPKTVQGQAELARLHGTKP